MYSVHVAQYPGTGTRAYGFPLHVKYTCMYTCITVPVQEHVHVQQLEEVPLMYRYVCT